LCGDSLRDRVFVSEVFMKSERFIREPIRMRGKEVGSISVFYRGEGEIAFLYEEGQIVLSLAERLGKILQRIESMRALRESEERYRVTLSSIGDAVLSTDEFGIVTFANEVACDLIGLSEDKIVGKRVGEIMDIFGEDTGEPAEIPVEFVLKTGKKIGLVNHTGLRSKNGKIYSIADSAAPITREDGETAGIILIFRDITEDKKDRRSDHSERTQISRTDREDGWWSSDSNKCRWRDFLPERLQISK